MNATTRLCKKATPTGASHDPVRQGGFDRFRAAQAQGRTASGRRKLSGPAAWAWLPLSVVCLQAGTAFAAGDCGAGLTPAQRAKFQLALSEACSTTPDAAAALAQRALVTPTAAPSSAPRGEAVQLQLFDAQGAVHAAGDATPIRPLPALGALPSPAASALTRPAAPARSQRLPAATERALQLAPDVDAAAQRHDIDPLLLHAIAYVESRHNPQARSPAGARGLMQVMPATAQRFGVSLDTALSEPRTNLEVSAAYLKTLQGRFGTDLPLVLAAYNAGEGAVERYGRRVPPYAETRSYVRQVLERYQWLVGVARSFAPAGAGERR